MASEMGSWWETLAPVMNWATRPGISTISGVKQAKELDAKRALARSRSLPQLPLGGGVVLLEPSLLPELGGSALLKSSLHAASRNKELYRLSTDPRYLARGCEPGNDTEETAAPLKKREEKVELTGQGTIPHPLPEAGSKEGKHVPRCIVDPVLDSLAFAHSSPGSLFLAEKVDVEGLQVSPIGGPSSKKALVFQDPHPSKTLTQWHHEKTEVVEPVWGLASQLFHKKAQDDAQVALVPCHGHFHWGRHVGIAVTAAGRREVPRGSQQSSTWAAKARTQSPPHPKLYLVWEKPGSCGSWRKNSKNGEPPLQMPLSAWV